MTDWVTNNIGVVVGWFATVCVFIWKMSRIVEQSKANGEKMESLAKAFREHEMAFDGHASDGAIHTTFEYRQSINARLDKIETEVKDGHYRIDAKLDKLIDKLLVK